MGSGGSKKNLEPEDKWVSYQICVLNNNNKYSILINALWAKYQNLGFDYQIIFKLILVYSGTNVDFLCKLTYL